ncbi:histone-lysine N-methyltransferase SETMAR [Plakobranchus ocellatus]|uniref:Histone-lysine N-methyltransferase SETMAR n=1 Tax=Plakobranchus ocellatus TaxID=259542 RepID=A0AAV3ZFF0_9GAST|nr:histone-lysine N-methyltransferase SETMAR [Plakobranchus ocellatus]
MATPIKEWSKLEVRVVVRFLFLKGTKPSEIHKQIAETYGSNSSSSQSASYSSECLSTTKASEGRQIGDVQLLPGGRLLLPDCNNGCVKLLGTHRSPGSHLGSHGQGPGLNRAPGCVVSHHVWS